MDTHTYPGRGLSLSELVFALKEELKRVMYSPLFNSKAVSQLDRDASSALATIREWKNSFTFINRIPTDILSLIPTHLASQKDLFHAASVCRHWRRVLLENGALWSQLFLIKGEDCVSTLLERAKGSALDIIAHHDAPSRTISLISSRSQQIRCLEITQSYWQDIITFSESISGRLPLLRNLKISILDGYIPGGQPSVVTPSSLHLFGGSTNLEKLVLRTATPSFLSHFIFPNLTTLELSAFSVRECSASYLLDFLKASPALQTVEVDIPPAIVLRDIPQEMVVALPNVKTISLHVFGEPTTHVYNIAAHISCPCARYTYLTHEVFNTDLNADVEIFPTPVSWNKIIRQYMASPIEEVSLGLKLEDLQCSLTFRSSGATVVTSNFGVIETGENEDALSFEELGWEIFYQALNTIQDRPLLSHVKRFHIKYTASMPDPHGMGYMMDTVRELFSSLGPLDELTIHGCDLRIFLAEFLGDLGFDDPEQPIVFPHIKELTILHPSMNTHYIECMDAIEELAKSQHALGIPFERVKIRMWDIPGGMAEELRRWVDIVDCRAEIGP